MSDAVSLPSLDYVCIHSKASTLIVQIWEGDAMPYKDFRDYVALVYMVFMPSIYSTQCMFMCADDVLIGEATHGLVDWCFTN